MLKDELKDASIRYLKAKEYERSLMCVKALYQEEKDIEFVKGIRSKLTEIAITGDRDVMNLLKESYILTAKDSFDDFMIAMEWDRTPDAKFWLPRRRVLEEKFKIASTIQRFLDDDSKLLTLSLPPGTGKTTIIKFLIAYIMGKFPQSQNMYCSYSDGMLKLVYDSLIAMTSKGEYNFDEIFGLGMPEVSSEYKTLSYAKKGNFPTVGLVALGGSVTGRTRANKFFITDDLVKNDEVARSPERLETLWSDYSNTLTTRMIGNAKEIMLGTIWSLYDPISRKKTKFDGKKGYEFLAFPVCDDEGHSNFYYDHPDRYSDERIKELKEGLDPVVFSCLYLQKGVEKEGLAFSADRLKYYNGVLPDGEPDNIMFYGDVAWGGGDSFSAPIAYIYGKDVYIHDVLFDRGDKTITKPRLVAKILSHKIKMGRLEANNGGGEYCDDINKLLKKEDYSMNLGAKMAAGNTAKLIRIEQHQQAIRDFYYLAEGYRSPEYKQFMNELTIFSFTSKNLHDDAPDSLAGLCDFLYKGKTEVRVMARPF